MLSKLIPSHLSLPFIGLLAVLLLGSCAHNADNIYPLQNIYFEPQSLSDSLSAMYSRASDRAELHVIGFSQSENIPIKALEIGSDRPERKILLIGQHHGDEVMGIEIVMRIASKLLSNDDRSKAILAKNQIWIIPTINPEGWKVVRSGVYQWKRKNNRDSNRNGVFDFRDDGVDLNRNYPVFWDEDILAPVSDPYYKGSSAASEAEVKAVIALAERQSFDLAIFYHSSASGMYSEKIYLPAYDKDNREHTGRMGELIALADYYASKVRMDYRRRNYLVSKGSSSRVGNARNYFFHRHSIPAFLIEVGGINRDGVSVIHPGYRILERNREQHSEALLDLILLLQRGGENETDR